MKEYKGTVNFDSSNSCTLEPVECGSNLVVFIFGHSLSVCLFFLSPQQEERLEAFSLLGLCKFKELEKTKDLWTGPVFAAILSFFFSKYKSQTSSYFIQMLFQSPVP